MRLIGIAPVAVVPTINTRLEALGLGVDTFSAQFNGIGDTDDAPATHYGCDFDLPGRLATRIRDATEPRGVVWYDEGSFIERRKRNSVTGLSFLLVRLGLKRRLQEDG